MRHEITALQHQALKLGGFYVMGQGARFRICRACRGEILFIPALMPPKAVFYHVPCFWDTARGRKLIKQARAMNG